MQAFKSPKESLGDLGAKSAAHLIASATDVAVIVDGEGVIRDVAFNKEDLALELNGHGRWLGAKLIDVVTPETQSKIQDILQDIKKQRPAVWRQVNHPSSAGEEVPVLYSAIDIGRKDRLIVVGKDLRSVALMQQRLLSAQQSMERDYTRLRNSETRYRLLFQVSLEGVMVVESVTRKISEANPAALALLGESAPRLLKSNLMLQFDPEQSQQIDNFLNDVKVTGRDRTMKVRLAKDGRECTFSASLFRVEDASSFLVRLMPLSPLSTNAELRATSVLLRYFESAADAMVITQHEGLIVRANSAFLDLAELASEEQARNQPLDNWIGRTAVDFGVVLASLRQNESVKMFSSVVRGAYGSVVEIEMSAVSLKDEDKPSFGFTIRNINRRLSDAPESGQQIPRSIAQLTQMIGRVPLRDIVRETTDVIEKLSIEAALELTGDNRASAAEMLGLSRQSLYVKLRRYGLADSMSSEDSEDE